LFIIKLLILACAKSSLNPSSTFANKSFLSSTSKKGESFVFFKIASAAAYCLFSINLFTSDIK
jgi:hypothetical protein